MSGNILTGVPSLPYRCCPPAEWVVAREISTDTDDSAPQHYFLVDYQLRSTDVSIERFSRFCFQVNDASCIENASQHLFEVDPDSQKLHLHRCDIKRGDTVIDAMDRDNIQVLQRESGLEQQMSNGRLTIELLIDDVRVGDIITLESTTVEVAGDHPLHGSTLWHYFSMGWGVPVDKQLIRLINDSSTPLYVHRLDSAQSLDAREKVQPHDQYEHEVHNITAQRGQNNLPDWYWRACLIVSNSGDWRRVASQLHGYYRSAGVFDDALDLEQIPVDLSKPDENTLREVIEFVQNQVRYRSDGSGVFSHTPRKPSITLRKRAGDCKDKSMLLVALLRRAGFDAHLALVHTGLRDAIMKLDASPYLFDHMVVCIGFSGRQYFIDATVQHQAGNLAVRAQSDCKCALLLSETTDSLTRIDTDQQQKVFEVSHHIDLSGGTDKAPVITIEREYHRHRADNMRYHFASRQRELLEQDYHGYASDDLGLKLSVIEAVHIAADDTRQNVLRVRERYRVETARDDIDDGCLGIRTDFCSGLLIAESCSHPVDIELDGIVHHHIGVTYPGKPDLSDDQFEEKNRWFEYRDYASASENRLNCNVELTPKASWVDAADIDTYNRAANKVHERSVTRIPLSLSGADNQRLGRMMFLWVAFIAALVVIFR